MRSNDSERFEKFGSVMAKGSQASIQEHTYTDIGPEYKFIILKILKKGLPHQNGCGFICFNQTAFLSIRQTIFSTTITIHW